MSTSEEFDKIVEEVQVWSKTEGAPKLDDLEKLKLYGLFKQATGEDFSAAPKPEKVVLSFLDSKTAKYNAWQKVKDVSAEDAQAQYVELVKSYMKKRGYTPPPPKAITEEVKE